MSEKYEEFAKTVYKTIQKEITTALKETGGSILVFSGEQHKDEPFEQQLNNMRRKELEQLYNKYGITQDFQKISKKNYGLTPADQEPALAGAYTHVATLKAAIEAVGTENVILSLELPENKISKIRSNLEKTRDPKINLSENHTPMYQAIAFADRNSIKVAASSAAKSSKDISAREVAIQENLRQLAPNTRIVVHAGGSNHLPLMQGHKDNEIKADNGTQISTSKIPPLGDAYTGFIYLNSTRLPTHQKAFFKAAKGSTLDSETKEVIQESLALNNYTTNPENAVQIDAPGAMDQRDNDIDVVIDRIEKAALEENITTPRPESAITTPTPRPSP